jgi:hypothetical protein
VSGHLERSGVEVTLLKADALALPFDDGSSTTSG